ncbi:VOC family protein [Psychromicrobium xiongbiense]|uniref:VOC family protein n=1 Tax=Psychromicrobium xiongbiense TaxID=3051184 RepID=UPI0025532710|nr:VOC family protein [Psychromicrobium sp. YIM S02556]
MSYSLQIAVDAEDPHMLADWWAETLGWTVEPSNEEFIRSMIAQGFATEADTLIHHGMLVWNAGQAIRPPEGLPNAARILFQTVPAGEVKTTKNRVHWDINLQGEDKAAVRSALEARGATFLWEASQGPHSWYTMADPEGNEFCVS